MAKTSSDKQTKKKVPTRKTLNLASLHEISRVLGASYDLDKILNLILTTMMKQTNADSGSLMLLDHELQELYIRAYRGISDNIARKTKIKLGQGISGKVALTKRPLLIDNKNFYSKYRKRPRKQLNSSLSIPLTFSDKLIGVINLNRIPGSDEFTENDLEAISKFAIESSIAIHNAQLYIEAEEKIQYLFRFNVISCALNTALNHEKLLDVLTDCICELFQFDFYTLLLVEKNVSHLLVCTQNKLDKTILSVLKKNLTLVVSGLKKKKIKPKNVILTKKAIKTHQPYKRTTIMPTDVRSVLNAPVISKGNILGMLSIYSVRENGFNQKDQQSLSTLANQAAVALENSNLYRSLRKTYLSTIKALAQAIEEKDEYTRGHSELVSYYAVSMATALQLPPKLIDGIQIAGILHDIGKIGIPEKILSKPTTLTLKEYEVIKSHPIIGKRILGPVNFYWAEPADKSDKKRKRKTPVFIDLNKKIFGQLKDPLEVTIDIIKTADLSEEIKTMIYHHHERYGGGGYPDGIKGDSIPIGSRILAVADTFEAMTAERPYRKAFPVKKALTLLKKCAPEQLDPKIVDLFIKLIHKNCIKVKQFNTKRKEGLNSYGRQ